MSNALLSSTAAFEAAHIPAQAQTPTQNEFVKKENFVNLWRYLKIRYPGANLESKGFLDLIQLKKTLEGPRSLRDWSGELAYVRKR